LLLGLLFILSVFVIQILDSLTPTTALATNTRDAVSGKVILSLPLLRSATESTYCLGLLFGLLFILGVVVIQVLDRLTTTTALIPNAKVRRVEKS
jgi:uncharacterized membrane protein